MKKLLQFPKERSKKVVALQKAEGQKLFLSMSLFSLLMVAVFANEQMVKTERPLYIVTNTEGPQRLDALNRAIASAQPVNAFRDLEWEHSLAKKLGTEIDVGSDRQPASVAQSVTLMDDLRYGPLAGKYRIRSVASVDKAAKISEIEYVDSSEISDEPVQMADTAGFLSKYKSLMNAEYSTATMTFQGEGREEWQLLDYYQNPVGKAHISRDSEGKLLRLAIEN